MICKYCGSKKVKVTDTINGPDGRVCRMRKCAACSRRFRTIETLDDGSEQFDTDYYLICKYERTKKEEKR